MHKAIITFSALSTIFLPLAVQSAEIDETNDLRLRCGAGYLLIADMPEMNNTDEEIANFKRMAKSLLSHADEILAKQGVPGAEREEIGRRYTMEMDEVLTKDLDLGFEPEDCPDLVAEADAAALEAEINKYMTCGVGFMAAARVKQDEGDTKVAADLEALGTSLANRGDDLMVEAGYNEAARYQLGQLYGESIGAKFKAGEDLEYDWDTCASLGN
ncbi:hypothetical protein GGR20_003657 [Devosia subaequoris]|uniref:Uncharacterized protein n=1 Tax=Devosia subaequoris TaxID=395930 RepID=A0A7W6IQK8_9HYPH|nr:hypothetical protein [Devosia subaequoris]MBB4053985.1 hypothetical protein [Devosia subaequoris]MCP1211536.1 hypothetical protein [Devosia subaequoris]